MGILSLTEADSTENIELSYSILNMVLDDIQQRLSGMTNLSDYTMERAYKFGSCAMSIIKHGSRKY